MVNSRRGKKSLESVSIRVHRRFQLLFLGSSEQDETRSSQSSNPDIRRSRSPVTPHPATVAAIPRPTFLKC